MKIVVGSTNPAKVNAVKKHFTEEEILGMEVGSKVSSQPYSDEETYEGAINRARECANSAKGCMGIGLEGGVMELENELYLCNWGVLVDAEENTFTASGARIPLPEEIAKELEKGRELGDVMDAFAEREGIRLNEGAIGIFTNNLVSRMDMFEHVVLLLKGQYEFFHQQRK
ncbi:DUF84 family protein [Pontibacillus salicampi]|uniref:Probable inosine/xanthosine triphosphatase n=1 Tax=Pontibacillus salicampi TaxID=1449801 RepID=A0ABV6LIQ5_9BACI